MRSRWANPIMTAGLALLTGKQMGGERFAIAGQDVPHELAASERRRSGYVARRKPRSWPYMTRIGNITARTQVRGSATTCTGHPETVLMVMRKSPVFA